MILPPYAQILGIELEAGPGAPVLAMPFGPRVLGRPGFVHGGALAGLLEIAAISALRHALAGEARDEAVVKPVNVTVDFMRGGREKVTRAQGHVTRLGTRIANVEAVAWQDDRDRPVAAARMHFLLA
ncbi:PaaI family thioesterase [Sphingomonas sp.]|uniref:PaaI family thioesterase n=1 Tax=Sphingomonas sp. TaxID=28214 RepID=UPI001EBC5DD4|nr:PaaI family thioesterase [Sphingomonas sp.]MBX3595358.1 PaaI family thioesterase [Sphingomonas sp.]